jgi:hypothetical protein
MVRAGDSTVKDVRRDSLMQITLDLAMIAIFSASPFRRKPALSARGMMRP